MNIHYKSKEFKPAFSVLVPVYNSNKYLSDCIDSVINQSFPDFELILVDDGSTDGSGLICDKYSLCDDRINVIHHKNSGPLYSREIALKQAKGEYILFLDSDDKLESHALDVLYSCFDSYSVDIVIFGFSTFLDNAIIRQTEEFTKRLVTNKRDLYKTVYFDSAYNALWRKAFKRKLYSFNDYSNYYHLNIAEDLLQSLSIYSNSESVLLIPDRLYLYRFNDSSLTHTLLKQDYIPDFSIQVEVLNTLLGENVLTDDDITEYLKYCVEDLLNTIKKVACSNLNVKAKTKIMESISNEPYYVEYLKTILPKKRRHQVIYFLFRKKMYYLIITLYKFL